MALIGCRATVYFARPGGEDEAVILSRRRLLATEIAIVLPTLVGRLVNPLLDLADQFPPSDLPTAPAEYFRPPVEPENPVQLDVLVDLTPDRYGLLVRHADDIRLGLMHSLRDLLTTFGGAPQRAQVNNLRASLRLDTLYTAGLMLHSSVITDAMNGDVERIRGYRLPVDPFPGLPPAPGQ